MYVQLDAPVPGELFVGKGYCLYVSGWVADSDKPIQGLSIGYGEGWTELVHWRLPALTPARSGGNERALSMAFPAASGRLCLSCR